MFWIWWVLKRGFMVGDQCPSASDDPTSRSDHDSNSVHWWLEYCYTIWTNEKRIIWDLFTCNGYGPSEWYPSLFASFGDRISFTPRDLVTNKSNHGAEGKTLWISKDHVLSPGPSTTSNSLLEPVGNVHTQLVGCKLYLSYTNHAYVHIHIVYIYI